MSEKKLNVGVLVSGRGTNLQALIDACGEGRILARIAVVISNRPGAPALERAAKAGIPCETLVASKNEGKEAFEKRIEEILKRHGVDLVVLAGFMRIVSPWLISRFKNRIINIHPALLPSFPGLESQRQALEYGVKFSGCTVHFVNEGCDTGPIILQAAVPVLPGDTVESLSERILAEEHQLLPKAVDLLAKNKVKIAGRRVEILEEQT
ncbi:MAG: phosphoribosylglycinamide formyltransferase [Deltaproteobacteria bacterium]|nr:phosphoribosylglycinamide formyltransferase [Deltaproteobacteria bacterium]